VKFLFRTLLLTRYLVLKRQLKEVDEAVRELNAEQRRELVLLIERELGCAAASPAPHLYGAQRIHASAAWGDGNEIAIERVRASNVLLKLRGLAAWLAIAYHETRTHQSREMQDLHRQVMRSIRLLREGLRPQAASESTLLASAWV
jgi:hypothetical protein